MRGEHRTVGQRRSLGHNFGDRLQSLEHSRQPGGGHEPGGPAGHEIPKEQKLTGEECQQKSASALACPQWCEPVYTMAMDRASILIFKSSITIFKCVNIEEVYYLNEDFKSFTDIYTR